MTEIVRTEGQSSARRFKPCLITYDYFISFPPLASLEWEEQRISGPGQVQTPGSRMLLLPWCFWKGCCAEGEACPTLSKLPVCPLNPWQGQGSALGRAGQGTASAVATLTPSPGISSALPWLSAPPAETCGTRLSSEG